MPRMKGKKANSELSLARISFSAGSGGKLVHGEDRF